MNIIEELKAWKNKDVIDSLSIKDLHEFNQILSRHQATEQGGGLSEYLNKIFANYISQDKTGIVCSIMHDVSDYCHRHQSESEPLPLAVLADRKGLWIQTNRAVQKEDGWMVHLGVKGYNPKLEQNSATIWAPTYAAAELQARKYLESLEDVK